MGLRSSYRSAFSFCEPCQKPRSEPQEGTQYQRFADQGKTYNTIVTGSELTALQPIQRITRYELLFKDLCRLTPSCDDPISHAVLDDVLYRLGETCRNVDDAKDNPDKLRLMENSRLLQERLCFPDKVRGAPVLASHVIDRVRFHVSFCSSVSADCLFAALSTSPIATRRNSMDAT